MKKSIIALTVLTTASMAANAEVRINGFANFTGGITSSDDSLYGYDDDISFGEESLFALQLSGEINDKMSATGQIVARGENDYDAEFEWAYISYQATDNTTLSAGRFRLPLFNYSASSDVGYSYHWISTPQVVYDVAFNNLDGIKADYANYAGDWEYNISASFGTFEGEANGSVNTGDNVWLLSAEGTYDWFKVRAVIGGTKTNLDLSTSNSASIRAAATGLEALAAAGFTELENALQVRDDKGSFYGLSLSVDKFDWFVSGEFTRVEVDESFAAPDDAFYVTAGIRSGAWTPSVTYQSFKSEAELNFQGLIGEIATSALPDKAKAEFTGLAAGLQLSQETEYDVISAGVRYDYDTNIAFKADISKRSDDVNPASDATLVRFSINYVF